MKKSVYSLVLADDVVDAIDQLAYSMNTSRSNLINQILAEKVSMSTPEMRMRDIFRTMQTLMDDSFQLLDPTSDSMFSIRSQLKYKYKPTIRYSLEISSTPKQIGRLKISFRTSSQALTAALNNFFQIWNTLELNYLRDFFPEMEGIQTDCTRYIRTLRIPAGHPSSSTEQLSNTIASYIRMLDSMIKMYFNYIELPQNRIITLMERRYTEYLTSKEFPLI